MAGNMNKTIKDYFKSSIPVTAVGPISEESKLIDHQSGTASFESTSGAAPPYPDLGDPNTNTNIDVTKADILSTEWKDCAKYTFPAR
jgi:hypothetical protein